MLSLPLDWGQGPNLIVRERMPLPVAAFVYRASLGIGLPVHGRLSCVGSAAHPRIPGGCDK